MERLTLKKVLIKKLLIKSKKFILKPISGTKKAFSLAEPIASGLMKRVRNFPE